MKTVSWCFRTLSSYIAYLSITALTLPLTLTLTLLTLTPPLHKSDECTKLLFRAVRTFRGLGRGVYRILYWRGKLGDQNSGDCFSHYRLKRYEKCSLKKTTNRTIQFVKRQVQKLDKHLHPFRHWGHGPCPLEYALRLGLSSWISFVPELQVLATLSLDLVILYSCTPVLADQANKQRTIIT